MCQGVKRCCGHRVLSLFLDRHYFYLDRHYFYLDRDYCLLVLDYCLLDGDNSRVMVKTMVAGVEGLVVLLFGCGVFRFGS